MDATSQVRYNPIEDYGIIGNLHTVGLVGKSDASIDYLCYPDQDSPILFGRLLDSSRGGHFSISPPPSSDLISKQIYLTNSNILRTRFSAGQGVGQVTDFMPVACSGHKTVSLPWVVRKLEVVRGEFDFFVECKPTFNYGRDSHVVKVTGGSVRFESALLSIDLKSAHAASLRWEIVDQTFQLKNGKSVSTPLAKTSLHLYEGQVSFFVLGEADSISAEDQNKLESFLSDTNNYWQTWLSQCTYKGRWREIVYRSALALKLMTFSPTGAIVASPTTSLPEDSWSLTRPEHASAASRNWDYRFVWIRDAAFTIYAFLRIGFKEEARDFMRWVEERCHQLKEIGSHEGLRVLYDINGHHPALNPEFYHESILDHWEGYRGQGPVRIGNAAASQIQLDIYGDLMDSVYLCDKHVQPISWDFWQSVKCAIVEPVLHNWLRPDHGIWEMRDEPREYVHSKVMAWVALDRAIRLAQKRSLPGDISGWTVVRDAIKEEVMIKGWNEDIGAFTQYYGSTDFDASILIMPLVFFLSPSDPKILSTLRRIMQHPTSGGLTINHLVFRFASCSESVCKVAAEGTFTMCSFWLAEALARAGEHGQDKIMLQQSQEIFEDLLGYANHVGLFSEEIDLSGRALGNFPQAFTHLSLISAAFNIDRRLP